MRSSLVHNTEKNYYGTGVNYCVLDIRQLLNWKKFMDVYTLCNCPPKGFAVSDLSIPLLRLTGG